MDSKLIICQNIKIDKSYTNVLSYNLENMLNLVNSKAVYSQDNYNHIDYTKSEIMANVDYSVAINCNYIAFQNPRHGNKWYFAFIDDVKYKAPNQSLIYFTVDVWSTFFDDWNTSPCFVVREHVNDDTVGLHTVPETVTTGEYVVNAHLRDSYNRQTCHIVVASTLNPAETPAQKIVGATYNGIPYSYGLFDVGGINGLINFINALGDQVDAIKNVWLSPPWVVGSKDVQGAITPSDDCYTEDLGVSPITSLDGYTPVNKKMLTYPFCYMLLSNGQNQNAILQQEFWQKNNSNEHVIRMFGDLTPGCSVRALPINYKNDEICETEGINLGKFPTLSWSSDYYTLWQSENALNNVSSVANIGVSAVSGNYMGALSNISNLLFSDYRADRIPPQLHGNTNCGDVMYSMRANCFHVFRMTIKSEFARQIDKYFSRYGYKINETKTPNIVGRRNFNFIEIGKDECIGYGTVPSKYMEEINNICRQGVTIWHNHDNLGNYSVQNDII